MTAGAVPVVELEFRHFIRQVMFDKTKMNKMVAWGQYIHWANMQYEHREQLDEDCSGAIFFGVMSHWIAAQYVVIEGWYKLKESDETIDNLLNSYPDYVDIFRRCRNAVYHYQNKLLDKRIRKALKGEELYDWLVAIKWEFERYLYFYPFKEYGFNKDSIELSNEYFGCIGWKPSENFIVKGLNVFLKCRNYIVNNELNKLEHNQENDQMIAEFLKFLGRVRPNFLLSKLSRISGR